ncbi:MAG: hypothetical protein FD147_1694 [Chloroflexi bacterium]|nr:MAG: hypothetical protein FD147_1694 [Chloroflexota bacterium]MBA4376511.1 hypothetical protein [Anaerolinea sp.]
MKKMSIFVMVLCIAMLVAVTNPVQAAPHSTFYFEKVCDGSVDPNICVIQNAAAPFAVLNGGTIEYFDHAYFQNPAGMVIESATVLVTASDGSQATGHVRWVKDRGYYTLLPGTGSLKNLHLIGKVATISWETMTFSVSGKYFFTP